MAADGFPRPDATHNRNPECIEAIAELGGRVTGLEHWQARQNGSLGKLVDAFHAQSERLAGMDEKLSTLIARQAEDRQRVEKLQNTHDSGPVVAAAPARPPAEAGEKPRWWYLLLGAALAAGAGVAELLKLMKG